MPRSTLNSAPATPCAPWCTAASLLVSDGSSTSEAPGVASIATRSSDAAVSDAQGSVPASDSSGKSCGACAAKSPCACAASSYCCLKTALTDKGLISVGAQWGAGFKPPCVYFQSASTSKQLLLRLLPDNRLRLPLLVSIYASLPSLLYSNKLTVYGWNLVVTFINWSSMDHDAQTSITSWELCCRCVSPLCRHCSVQHCPNLHAGLYGVLRESRRVRTDRTNHTDRLIPILRLTVAGLQRIGLVVLQATAFDLDPDTIRLNSEPLPYDSQTGISSVAILPGLGSCSQDPIIISGNNMPPQAGAAPRLF